MKQNGNGNRTWSDSVMVTIALCAGAKITDAVLQSEGRVSFELTNIPDNWNARLDANDFLIPAGDIFRATKVLRQVIRDVKANRFTKEQYNANPYFARQDR